MCSPQPGGRRPLHIGTIFQPRPEKKNSRVKLMPIFSQSGKKCAYHWRDLLRPIWHFLLLSWIPCNALSTTYPNSISWAVLLNRPKLFVICIIPYFARIHKPLERWYIWLPSLISNRIQLSEKEGKIQLGKGNWWQKWRSNWMSLPVDRRGMLAVFTLAERPLAG